MIDFGDVPANSVLPIKFASYGKTNGESITLSGLAVTDIEVYPGTSMTQRASDNGYALLDTDGIDLDGVTGIHGFSIDLSDNSDSGFYAVGTRYTVIVSSVTIDGQTVNFPAATFRIVAAESIAGKPKVDVDAFGGAAGTFSGGRPEVITKSFDSALGLTTAMLTQVEQQIDDQVYMHVGTAQSASASYIQLAAGASSQTNAYQECLVWIYSGTGAGQVKRISQYDGTSKQADLYGSWQANPDNTSLYRIIAASGIATQLWASVWEDYVPSPVVQGTWGWVIGPKVQDTVFGGVSTESLLVLQNTTDTSGKWDQAVAMFRTGPNQGVYRRIASYTFDGVNPAEVNLEEPFPFSPSGGNEVWIFSGCELQDVAAATKLRKYVQLLARSDAGIETDNATELSEINSDGGSGAGTFASSSHAEQALRDRGDAAWTTATGFSTLDAAGVRTAVGLASANLDTQLADIPTVSEFNARTLAAADYATAANQTTILARLGAWTGTGLNSVLGALRALWNKTAGLTPSDLTSGITAGDQGDNTTDSLPALQEAIAAGGGGGDCPTAEEVATATLAALAAAGEPQTVVITAPAITAGGLLRLFQGDSYPEDRPVIVTIAATGVGLLTADGWNLHLNTANAAPQSSAAFSKVRIDDDTLQLKFALTNTQMAALLATAGLYGLERIPNGTEHEFTTMTGKLLILPDPARRRSA